jgi:hypothetical protein
LANAELMEAHGLEVPYRLRKTAIRNPQSETNREES